MPRARALTVAVAVIAACAKPSAPRAAEYEYEVDDQPRAEATAAVFRARLEALAVPATVRAEGRRIVVTLDPAPDAPVRIRSALERRGRLELAPAVMIHEDWKRPAHEAGLLTNYHRSAGALPYHYDRHALEAFVAANAPGEGREWVIEDRSGDQHREWVAWMIDRAKVIAPNLRGVEAVEERGVWYVRVDLDAAGAAALRELSRVMVDRPILILVDGEVVMTPYVKEEITTDSIVLEPGFSFRSADERRQDAGDLAVALRSVLPAPVRRIR